MKIFVEIHRKIHIHFILYNSSYIIQLLEKSEAYGFWGARIFGTAVIGIEENTVDLNEILQICVEYDKTQRSDFSYEEMYRSHFNCKTTSTPKRKRDESDSDNEEKKQKSTRANLMRAATKKNKTLFNYFIVFNISSIFDELDRLFTVNVSEIRDENSDGILSRSRTESLSSSHSRNLDSRSSSSRRENG